MSTRGFTTRVTKRDLPDFANNSTCLLIKPKAKLVGRKRSNMSKVTQLVKPASCRLGLLLLQLMIYIKKLEHSLKQCFSSCVLYFYCVRIISQNQKNPHTQLYFAVVYGEVKSSAIEKGNRYIELNFNYLNLLSELVTITYYKSHNLILIPVPISFPI